MINKYYICIVLLSVSIVLSSCKNNEKSIDDKNYEESVQEDSVIDEGVSIEDVFIDSVFREYVSKKYDKDKDGILTNDEISNITEISINGSKNDNYQNLKSLKGIEQFRNLEKLTCCACKLDEIDVTNNSELEGLSIGYTQITNIDLSQNVKLEILEFVGNTNIYEIDLSQNISLKSIYCSESGIKELDLSNNPNVYEVECNKDTKIISDEKIEYLIRY